MADADALPLFEKEMMSLEWEKGLTSNAYEAITRRLGGLSEDEAPEIPRLSFVRCALFIADAPGNGARRLEGGVYLIEELLDAEKFYKWLGNASVLPLDEDDNDFTAFLNFLQHVQWVESGCRMFVSDFQGVDNKLTDPQIMTHAEFTDKFTDANVLSGFKSLSDQHNCEMNMFCSFFDMTPPKRDPMAVTVIRSKPGKDDQNRPEPTAEGEAPCTEETGTKETAQT